MEDNSWRESENCGSDDEKCNVERENSSSFQSTNCIASQNLQKREIRSSSPQESLALHFIKGGGMVEHRRRRLIRRHRIKFDWDKMRRRRELQKLKGTSNTSKDDPALVLSLHMSKLSCTQKNAGNFSNKVIDSEITPLSRFERSEAKIL